MAAVMANTYKYEHLKGTRGIRLITICPGVGDETIFLSIEHVSLDDKPVFEALSYVWGPQNPSYSVQCDDASLAIGGNLRDAIRCVRRPDVSLVLWIDRIAINQEDPDERAQQVGFMGDIYSSASHENSGVKSYPEGLTVKDPFQYPALDAPVWAVVRSLLRRPWFSRVWTFQEIVLAKNPILHCGAHWIRWIRLEVCLLGMSTFSEGPNVEDSRLKGAEVAAFEIMKARSVLHMPEVHKPGDTQLILGLLPLLNSLRLRQATDPRDKVFAVLNVAYDAKNSDLKADYRKSHAEVYAMTAKWFLRTQKRLDFLHLVEAKDTPDLISWVPNFRYRDSWNFLHQTNNIFTGTYHFYNTSGSTNATTVDTESDYQLTVSGIYLGTVVDRTMPPGNLKNNVAIGAPVLDGGQWHSFARTCAVNGVYPATGESIDLAYHRLRIWDQLPTEENRRQRTSLITAVPQPGPVSYEDASNAILHGFKKDIGMSILSKTTRKRMFKTETGYLGIAHRSVEIGDKVYVLMGGDMPFVLRPFGGNYFGYGGEFYVHGVMDGELLAFARANGEDLKSIGTNDLAWIDQLGDEPWPFTTEKLILV